MSFGSVLWRKQGHQMLWKVLALLVLPWQSSSFGVGNWCRNIHCCDAEIKAPLFEVLLRFISEACRGNFFSFTKLPKQIILAVEEKACYAFEISSSQMHATLTKEWHNS